MIRFLHTADWQIGMRAAQAGEKAQIVREERLETAARVVDLANERGVDFILLAGDTFEDNAIDRTLIQRVADILGKSRSPVFVLPGNHDPLGPASVYEHPCWKGIEPKVRVVRSAAPIALDGVTLLPSPCFAKYSTSDPTERIPPRNGTKGIRIGIAHGSLLDRGQEIKRDDFPISPQRAEALGLNYLALGHWHSTWIEPSEKEARIAYPGTPEPTAFGETDSGNVLLVTIEEEKKLASLERIPVGGLRWVAEDATLSTEEEAKALFDKMESLAPAEKILLRIRLKGALPRSAFEIVRRIEEIAQSRFLLARIEREGVLPLPEDAVAWSAVLPDGVPRTVAERLIAAARGGDSEASPETASRALEILLSLSAESRS